MLSTTSTAALRRHLEGAGPELGLIMGPSPGIAPLEIGHPPVDPAAERQLVLLKVGSFDGCSTPRDQNSSGSAEDENSSMGRVGTEHGSGDTWPSESPSQSHSSEEAGACPKDPKNPQAPTKRPPSSPASSQALGKKYTKVGHLHPMDQDPDPSSEASSSPGGWLLQLRQALVGVDLGLNTPTPPPDADSVNLISDPVPTAGADEFPAAGIPLSGDGPEVGPEGVFMTPRETFDSPHVQERAAEPTPEFPLQEEGDSRVPVYPPVGASSFVGTEPELTREEVYRSLQNLYHSLTNRVEEAQGEMASAQSELQGARLLIAQLAERVASAESWVQEKMAATQAEVRAEMQEAVHRLSALQPSLENSVAASHTKVALLELEQEQMKEKISRLGADAQALQDQVTQLSKIPKPGPSAGSRPASSDPSNDDRVATVEMLFRELNTRVTTMLREVRDMQKRMLTLESTAASQPPVTTVANTAEMKHQMAHAMSELEAKFELRLRAMATHLENRLDQRLREQEAASQIRLEREMGSLGTEVAALMKGVARRLTELDSKLHQLDKKIQAVAKAPRQTAAPSPAGPSAMTPLGATPHAVQAVLAPTGPSSPPPQMPAQPAITKETIEEMLLNAITNAVQQAIPSANTVGTSGPAVPMMITNVQQPQPASAPGVDMSSIPRVQRRGRRAMSDGATVAFMPSAPVTSAAATNTSSINQVRIAPVNATSAGMMNVLPGQLSAALLGAMPARFSGEPEDWPEWKRRWMTFLDNVESAMPGITDAQVLTIFKGLLDEASVNKLEAEQMVDPDVGYDEFVATLDLEFGGENASNLRSKWYGLRLHHKGAVRLSDWRTFSSQFIKLMVMLGDPNEEEAERLFLRGVPVEWKKKVEDEVEKRNREGILILEGLPATLDKTQVVAFLFRETSRAPKSIEPVSTGKWKVRCQDVAHRAAILQLNRQRLENGTRLGVHQVEERLKVKDIDELMRRWLKVNERASHSNRSERDENPRREDERRQRFTREVTAEAEADEAGDHEQMVARVEAPKSPARSTEVHPHKGKGKGNNANQVEPQKKDMAPSSAPPPQALLSSDPLSGSSGAAAFPQQQSNHLSPSGSNVPQQWDRNNGAWQPPQQPSWDPSWGAGWYQGYAEACLGKGQGSGKGSGVQGSGKGSGEKGKGKGGGKAGQGKGGRGHP